MPDVVLAVVTSTSPEKYQSKTSATPSSASAMNPSRDMDINAITLPTVHPFLVVVFLVTTARRSGSHLLLQLR